MLLSKIHKEAKDYRRLILQHCAPPVVANPGVLHRCAASARFVWEWVQEASVGWDSKAEGCADGEGSDSAGLEGIYVLNHTAS